MKKLIFIALVILPVVMKAPPIDSYSKQLRTSYYYKEQEKLRKNKELEKFLVHLSTRESQGNWKIINPFGYMGLYQMGNAALKDIDMGYITTSKFRSNPDIFPIYLQNIAVKKLIDRNIYLLRNYMKYIGCTINNTYITKSGLLAAAHLGGAGSVKRFIDSEGKEDFSDAFGTKISSYLKEFSDYKF